jgi:hypothetical protein
MKRFLKNLFQKLEDIKNKKYIIGCYESVNVYFEDESRYGLLTQQKRVLTAKGIKPVGPYQHKFENTYLFGSFSPINGDSFILDMPHCDSDCFQSYLNEFSLEKPKEFKIMILDNGAFHHAKRLAIPANIALIFLPPYSPELNPAEKMWAFFKRKTSMTIFENLDALHNYLADIITKEVNFDLVKSICGNQSYKTTFKNCFNV